jgi:superfamily II DNA or RNA helicase
VIELEDLFSLINKKFLSPITVKMLPIKIDLSGRGKGVDFTEQEADDIITPHLEEIAKQILIHGSFRRTLVFLPLIETCRKFNVIARDVGLNSDFIYGDDPERVSKLKRFKAWEFDVLANSMLLTRGVDIPEVDCICPARPTKSGTLYWQMVGRGTRIAKGKTDCILMDFLWMAGRMLVRRPAHLIAKSEEEAESIIALSEATATGLPADVAAELPMDLQKLSGEATAQREEALRKKLEQHKNKAAKTISAAEFALQHHKMDVAEFEPTMEWERKPVSEKQSKYIRQAGIDVESVKGCGHASQLLSLYFKSKELKMASHASRAALKKMGHPNWASATEREARTFFAEQRKPKTEEMFI